MVELTRNEILAVSTSSVIVSPVAKRISIYIRNTSTAGQVITLHEGNGVAVAGAGIVLDPGQTFFDVDGNGYESWKGRITAVASAINGQLSIFERVY